MKDKPYILQLNTMPASHITDNMPEVALRYSTMNQYRKELIKIGKYVKDSTKQAFEVTKETLNHWVDEFNKWTSNGNRVPIPLGHEREGMPEANQGWVTGMAVEDNSLFGIMELLDPDLALTTDVSICVEPQVVDGKGHKYKSIITHVALCTDPVVPGLDKFQTLSLSKGTKNMELLKKFATKLGIKDDNPTEELVLSAIDKKIENDKVVLSDLSVDTVRIDPIVKLISENRAIKLSNMVKAGLITPAVKDAIVAKYVEPKVLVLSLQNKDEDGFDFLHDIIIKNRPVKLNEVTGVQSLELSNQSVSQPNAVQKDIAKRRKAAGLND